MPWYVTIVQPCQSSGRLVQRLTYPPNVHSSAQSMGGPGDWLHFFMRGQQAAVRGGGALRLHCSTDAGTIHGETEPVASAVVEGLVVYCELVVILLCSRRATVMWAQSLIDESPASKRN